VCETVKSEDEDIHDQESSSNKGGLLTANGYVGRIHAGLMKLEPVVALLRINSSLLGEQILLFRQKCFANKLFVLYNFQENS